MAKIFVTGMNAPQASENANQKNFSFAGALVKTLRELGHEVTWSSPSVLMTPDSFSSFDKVLIGVGPITSLSSDRCYGVLTLIAKLWGDERLALFTDVSNPRQIEVSLNQISSNPANLVKPFYSYRKEYSVVSSSIEYRQWSERGVQLLLQETWPTTVYSSLPWKTLEQINLTPNAKKNLERLNVDAFLIDLEKERNQDRQQKWLFDYKSKWTERTSKTLLLPVNPMKLSKSWGDAEVYEQIERSLGVLISPDKREGTWWSYRYIQALNAGTPIATDWLESGVLGESWQLLASSIESMSQQKRNLIATAQLETYVANIPSKKEMSSKITEVLKLKES